MMQKLKVFVFVFAMLLGTLCTMTACSIAGDDSPKGAKDSQIEADIKVLESVQNGVINGYFMPVEKYELLNYSITKRQTNIDEKEDIVFLSVVIANSYVETTLEYTLEYGYYDQGGWILDNTQLTSSCSVPLKGVTESLVHPTRVTYERMANYKDIEHAICHKDNISYSLFDGYTADKFQLTERQTDLDSGVDILKYTYEDHYYKLLGNECFTFHQKYGWISDDGSEKTASKRTNGNIEVEIWNVFIDWDGALNGLFSEKSDPSGRYIQLDSQEEKEILVNFYREYSDCEYTKASNVKATLNTNTYAITFNATHYYKFSWNDSPYSERKVTLFYNFCEDLWHGSSSYTYGNHVRTD